MISLLDKNFATLAMLLSLGFVTTAIVVLILSGKCTGNDVAIASLCTAAGGLAGGIGGYSMHKQSEASATSTIGGVSITKTEQGS